jgi:hypothetical protein
MVYAKDRHREQLVDCATAPGEMKRLASDPIRRAQLLEGCRLRTSGTSGTA